VKLNWEIENNLNWILYTKVPSFLLQGKIIGQNINQFKFNSRLEKDLTWTQIITKSYQSEHNLTEDELNLY